MVEIKCESAPILASSLERCFSNIMRITNLLETFDISGNDDILRLSLVYLHATIEDCMRNLIYYKLTSNPEKDLLKQIPFKVPEIDYKIEKISLGELLALKDKPVELIISESIEDYVNRQTFNNTTDIINVLRNFKIDIKKITHLLPELSIIFSRRHNIVHNSDYKIKRSELNLKTQVILTKEISNEICEINRDFILKGINTTNQFFLILIPMFLPKGENITMCNI